MAAGGDITIIIIPDIIPVANIGVGDIGLATRTLIAVLREQAVIGVPLLRFAGQVQVLPVAVQLLQFVLRELHLIEEADKTVQQPDV